MGHDGRVKGVSAGRKAAERRGFALSPDSSA